MAASENALGRLQTPFDHVQQASPGVSRPRVFEAAQGTVDEQHRQAVNRRPGQELGARAPLAGQHTRLDEPVQGGGQQLEGAQAALPGPGRARGTPQVIRRREGRPEQPGLFLGEPQVAGPDGAQALTRRRQGPRR